MNKLETRVHDWLISLGCEVIVKPEVVVSMGGHPRRLEPDFIVPDQNLVVEAYGCYVHGCTECGAVPRNIERKRYKDRARLAALELAGYEVEIIWEHELLAA